MQSVGMYDFMLDQFAACFSMHNCTNSKACLGIADTLDWSEFQLALSCSRSRLLLFLCRSAAAVFNSSSLLWYKLLTESAKSSHSYVFSYVLELGLRFDCRCCMTTDFAVLTQCLGIVPSRLDNSITNDSYNNNHTSSIEAAMCYRSALLYPVKQLAWWHSSTIASTLCTYQSQHICTEDIESYDMHDRDTRQCRIIRRIPAN